MDLDGSKRVYWSEFIAAVCSRDVLTADQNLREAFQFFNRQQREFFDIEDFKKIILGEDPTYHFTDNFEESFVMTFGSPEVTFEAFTAAMTNL